MTTNTLQQKSYNFALRIVRLGQYLNNEKHEFTIARKLMDSGTSVGVLIEEARQGDSRTDFIQKFSVANKEAFKSNFWLRILRDTDYLNNEQAQSMLDDCEELQRMLIASLKTARVSD